MKIVRRVLVVQGGRPSAPGTDVVNRENTSCLSRHISCDLCTLVHPRRNSPGPRFPSTYEQGTHIRDDLCHLVHRACTVGAQAQADVARLDRDDGAVGARAHDGLRIVHLVGRLVSVACCVDCKGRYISFQLYRAGRS